MKKKLLSNLTLLLVSTLIAAIAGEVVCRVGGLSKTWESYVEGEKLMQNIATEAHSKVGFKRVPSQSFVGPREVTMSYNEAGFRDASWDKSKGKKKRYAFIGDSVTEGYGVEANDRYSDQLQDLLGEGYETLNFGISGHATFDQLSILQKDVFDYAPDAVILQVCANDFARNSEIETYLATGEEIPSHARGSAGGIKGFLTSHSAFYLALAERYNYFKLMAGKSDAAVASQQAVTDEQWASFGDTLEQMKSLCASNGADFVVTYVPLEVEVMMQDAAKAAALDSQIAQICADANIDYISSITALRNMEDLTDVYLDDCHLSVSGNQTVAELLQQQLNLNQP